MVFYRKYRPQTVQELDSEMVREKLYAALSQKEPSHAFLFTGPKGLGKTSAARIVAKVLNCEERNANRAARRVEPCNKCSQCVSITNGTNLDVLEIDGASNRGIDEIRDLRDKVRLAPVAASKKVYIIDEVHMLTTEAFNALLKTLEEPPLHVVFILCTTEPHKVPETIVSRCVHISFKLATQEELVRSFERIVEGEKLEVEKDALEYIARLSDGGFRDGAKILEELSSLAKGKKITKELVEQKFQTSNIQFQISNMLNSLAEKDTKGGLQLVAQLVEQGVDLKYFIEQMIQELHGMLLGQLGVTSYKLQVISYKLNTEEIRSLVELLTGAYGEMKYAVLPSLPLEMVIIEWGEAAGPVAPSSHPMSSVASSLRALDGTPSSRATRPSVSEDIWSQFIEKVKSHNHSIAGVLRGCSLKSHNEKEMVIQTSYKFHKERLSEKKTLELLEQVGKEISGNEIKVEVLLKV